MTKLFTLLGREIKSIFYSPVAYMVMCFVLFLAGFDFCWGIWIMERVGPTSRTLLWEYFNSPFFLFTFLLIFPLITMRSFSEEFKSGTIETLMTAPVRDWQVVISKWLGCVFFYVILWIPTAIYFWVYSWTSGSPASHAPGAYIAIYLLLLLMGMFYCAVGCLASALTSNQIIAAVMSLVGILVLLFGGLMQYIMLNVTGSMRDAFGYFSALDHFDSFASGVIDSRPVTWYLTMTLLMLVLTYQVFQTRKWKM